MNSVSNESNKQFIAVILFLLFIIGAIAGLIIMDNKKSSKPSNVNSGKNDISNAGTPEIEESSNVVIVVSNSNNTDDPDESNSNEPSGGAIIVTSNTANNSNNPNTNKNYIPIKYFITEMTANKIYVDGTSKITVKIFPDNATTKEVTYSSGNEKIATVSNTGLVRGISPGVCTIYINVNGGGVAEAQIQVYSRGTSDVTPISNSNPTSKSNSNSTSNSNPTSKSNSNTPVTIPVTDVTVNPSTVTLVKGFSSQLSATVSPSSATNKSIKWQSTNTSVVTVTSSGKITAVGAGEAYVRATANNGIVGYCKVTVTNPAPVKNGWYTEGQDRVYYENGNKKDKIGDFDLTLYDTTAWATSHTGNNLVAGDKLLIKGGESSGNILVEVVTSKNVNAGTKINVKADSLLINLPEVMPSINYAMSNAAGSPFVVSGFTNGVYSPEYSLSGVTGVNLYGYGKIKSDKLGRSEYYSPLNYAVAKYLQKALNNARNEGYSFIIYDTYRPTPVESKVHDSYLAVYNSRADVKRAVDRTINGFTYSLGWFMTNGYSMHSRGIAIDMGLTAYSGNKLTPSNDIKQAQTKYGVLDSSASFSLNNANANKLKSIMMTVKDKNIINTSANNCTNSNYRDTANGGVFFSLPSEWWHFDFRCTIYSPNRAYESFYLN